MSFKVLIPQLGTRGLPGSQMLAGAAAPEVEQGNDGDFFIRYGPESDTQLYGPKTDGAWGAGRSIRGGQGMPGLRGWNPLLLPEAVPVEVSEGEFEERILLRLAAWIGGQGSAPTIHVGRYARADGAGFTEDPAEAMDIRGRPGLDGVMSGAEVVFADDATIGSEEVGRNIVGDSADPLTLTLAAAGTLGDAWMAILHNAGDGPMTVAASGEETINGLPALVLDRHAGAVIWRAGAGFRANATAPAAAHKITYITASTSGFVFDAETRSAEIKLLAGGGAGGSNGTGSSGAAAAGGGGGAGEWARKRFAVAGLTSIAIVIGAGGAPGAPGANPGGDGGDTSWDDGVNVVTVRGGKGAQSGAYTSAHIRRVGGAGGSGGSGGDLHIAGQAGEPGVAIGGAIQTIAQLHPHPGKGGDSRWGSAAHAGNTGASSAAGSDGVPSQGHGAGGSGAFGCHADTDRQGSAGRPGLVVVREYR